ncbi:MAG: hypothetical protein U0L34_05020, partial [Paludibacteraceae bacterium]|nr:hypothetical protein [Paludibacteraceae bacterium]
CNLAIHRLLGLRPHEVWLRLGIVQTSLTLLSACTNFHRFADYSLSFINTSPIHRFTDSPIHPSEASLF